MLKFKRRGRAECGWVGVGVGGVTVTRGIFAALQVILFIYEAAQ